MTLPLSGGGINQQSSVLVSCWATISYRNRFGVPWHLDNCDGEHCLTSHSKISHRPQVCNWVAILWMWSPEHMICIIFHPHFIFKVMHWVLVACGRGQRHPGVDLYHQKMFRHRIKVISQRISVLICFCVRQQVELKHVSKKRMPHAAQQATSYFLSFVSHLAEEFTRAGIGSPLHFLECLYCMELNLISWSIAFLFFVRPRRGHQHLQDFHLSPKIPTLIGKVSIIFTGWGSSCGRSKDDVCAISHCCGDGSSLLLLCFSWATMCCPCGVLCVLLDKDRERVRKVRKRDRHWSWSTLTV